MSDEKKEIKLYDLDDVLLIPRPRWGQLGHYEAEIERLNEELQERHKEYMTMSAKLDKYRVIRLEKFRAVFLLDCIILRRELDLLGCRDTIAEGRCTFYDRCQPRKDLIEKLHLNPEERGDPQPSPRSSPIY